MLRPDPGGDADRGARIATVRHEGLDHDAAVLRHRLHGAAAPRSSRDDDRRGCRDGHAKAHVVTTRTAEPPDSRARGHRHGRDTGGGRGPLGAGGHARTLRVADAGRAHRGGHCRVLPRQGRRAGDRRPARREAACQLVVAGGRTRRLSELRHRRQSGGGHRRSHRPRTVERPARGGGPGVFRLPRVPRPRRPARRGASPPRGRRIAGAGHVGHRRRRPDHALERRPRTYAELSARTGAGAFARECGAGSLEHRPAPGDWRGVDDPDPADAHVSGAPFRCPASGSFRSASFPWWAESPCSGTT